MAACSDTNLQGDENPASELNIFKLGGWHQIKAKKPEAETAHGGHLFRHRKGANGSNDNKPNAHTEAH